MPSSLSAGTASEGLFNLPNQFLSTDRTLDVAGISRSNVFCGIAYYDVLFIITIEYNHNHGHCPDSHSSQSSVFTHLFNTNTIAELYKDDRASI